jgi:hypothetical protein
MSFEELRRRFEYVSCYSVPCPIASSKEAQHPCSTLPLIPVVRTALVALRFRMCIAHVAGSSRFSVQF